MTTQSIIVQQAHPTANALVLLFHGVGSVPQSMLAVAQWFAARDRRAMVVSVASPDPSDISSGCQWFSVRGVTEDNRQARVDAAMPGFVATVRHWQQVAGVGAPQTMLVGFSQGAIMALESTKLADAPAARVVSLAGRFATLPTQRPASSIHLLHGSADAVMPVALAEAAYQGLAHWGAVPTLDVLPGVGHEPHPALLEQLAAHLPTVG
ncbi:MAG: esterase [Rhodocyclaceae bacterium]